MTGDLRRRIEGAIRKHPDYLDWQIRCLFNHSRNDGGNPIESAADVAAVRAGMEGIMESKQGRSLTEFKQTYDKDTIVPGKIRAALEKLGDSWCYEKEFVEMSGVSFGDLAAYREMFEDCWVYIKRDSKRVWAGTPEFAAKLRSLA